MNKALKRLLTDIITEIWRTWSKNFLFQGMSFISYRPKIEYSLIQYSNYQHIFSVLFAMVIRAKTGWFEQVCNLWSINSQIAERKFQPVKRETIKTLIVLRFKSWFRPNLTLHQTNTLSTSLGIVHKWLFLQKVLTPLPPLSRILLLWPKLRRTKNLTVCTNFETINRC